MSENDDLHLSAGMGELSHVANYEKYDENNRYLLNTYGRWEVKHISRSMENLFKEEETPQPDLPK